MVQWYIGTLFNFSRHNACISWKLFNFAVMKPAIKFRQYIWIINTLRAYKRLTFVDLQEKWEKDDMGDGIEILEPLDLREKMRQMLLTSLKRYEE